eukprot:CAMPEP_0195524174 /NCGR_PEP_ID=MMETSP0794_2-20130614/23859_1 /TAXON_ID=515487 /ORGANISM="Stephanopyxis turris, Strain CCMP 815" /LENGTH=1122 /DNA_ID=CAMNT_0040654341 /DNA_START=200 /DNA_END=3568 /DNA_ORIENTATION=-
MTNPSIHEPGPSSTAMAILFGSILFATSSLAARTWLMGDTRAMKYACIPKSNEFEHDSFISIYALLYHLSVFGGILLFAFVCEYHPPFPHSDKSYDRDEFWFIIVLLGIVSVSTMKRNEDGGKGGGVDGEMMKRSLNEGKEEETKEKGIDSIRGSTGSDSPGLEDVNLIDDDMKLSSNKHQCSYSGAADSTKEFNPSNNDNPENAVLNRCQTEEWKGWMQSMFLLYHYYHAEEMYNSIRVMITCYVWMTGFGNFSFFYLKNDFSFVRVMQMLWRLNFLVVFLCLSQGTSYILYYICPLHTYYFLMVYVTMKVGSHVNYSRYGLRFKLLGLALIIFMVWDVDSGLFGLFHFIVLGKRPVLGATYGSMWEWYFRSSLDHWSAFLGMVFAANFPIISLFYKKVEAKPLMQQVLAKGVVGLGLFLALCMWIMVPFGQNKVSYNATNAYFGFVPLLSYVYFRNLTPKLRSYSLNLLHQIGKTTLETYLMQHHIWLTSDAKSLLTLIPGWPKVNMLVVTTIYYLTSRRLYKLTLYLRGMLLPDKNERKCIRNMICLFGIILAFYVLALSLDTMNLSNLKSIAVCSILCGLLLYQTVMDGTWQSYSDSLPSSPDADPMESNNSSHSNKPHLVESPIAKISPPLIGTMVLFCVGLLWQGMSIHGAGKVASLPASCEVDVNKGAWLPMNGCSEFQRGASYRDHGLDNIGTCHGSYVWGWNTTKSNTLCRFSHRPTKQLLNTLEHRRLVFIGDSMTRNVFHAFCRALGDATAGRYDATVAKHSDIYKVYGSTELEFKWAPLAVDQVRKFQDVIQTPRTSDEADLLDPIITIPAPDEENNPNQTTTNANTNTIPKTRKPDLAFLGGGAWDRLHLFSTDEDQKSHRLQVKELASLMNDAKLDPIQSNQIPTVWLNPTTIHTNALMHEDKRDHMKEENMQTMRDIHAELGVWAASSFLLDGVSFTVDRVQESYDGVHYPHQVYDAGAQILANALDWILMPFSMEEEEDHLQKKLENAPQPGKMANPFLGLMMLCFAFIGLFFFDGLLGFTYLATLVVNGVMPNDLYEEAFGPLHKKMHLPPIMLDNGSSGNSSAAFYQNEGHVPENHDMVGLLAARGGAADDDDDDDTFELVSSR